MMIGVRRLRTMGMIMTEQAEMKASWRAKRYERASSLLF
jgi:hypothetical protein